MTATNMLRRIEVGLKMRQFIFLTAFVLFSSPVFSQYAPGGDTGSEFTKPFQYQQQNNQAEKWTNFEIDRIVFARKIVSSDGDGYKILVQAVNGNGVYRVVYLSPSVYRQSLRANGKIFFTSAEINQASQN